MILREDPDSVILPPKLSGKDRIRFTDEHARAFIKYSDYIVVANQSETVHLELYIDFIKGFLTNKPELFEMFTVFGEVDKARLKKTVLRDIYNGMLPYDEYTGGKNFLDFKTLKFEEIRELAFGIRDICQFSGRIWLQSPPVCSFWDPYKKISNNWNDIKTICEMVQAPFKDTLFQFIDSDILMTYHEIARFGYKKSRSPEEIQKLQQIQHIDPKAKRQLQTGLPLAGSTKQAKKAEKAGFPSFQDYSRKRQYPGD